MARYDDDDDDDYDDDDDRFRGRRGPPPTTTNPLAIAALVLGICGMFAWCLPLCGVPVNLVGIILGGIGMSNPVQKGMSLTGLLLSILGMVLSLINAAVGAWMALHNGGF